MEKSSWKKNIHVIFEIEKENSNYVKEMFLLKTTLLSGKIFYFQKEVVISNNFKKNGKEVICIRKLFLKKEGFLLNKDCYFKGYLLCKEILTFQSVKKYYFKDRLICKRKWHFNRYS